MPKENESQTTPDWKKIAKILARGAGRVHGLIRMSYNVKDFDEIQRHFELAKRVNKKGFKP